MALTIAGSDSGGGAGIQADLKTFEAFGVWGTSALTGVTAQNTLGVHDALVLPGPLVRAQIDAVVGDLGVAAAKTGMLGSAAIIETVAAAVERHGLAPLIVDPVLVTSHGELLLEPDGLASCARLLPLAPSVTPNLPEAEALLGHPIPTRAGHGRGRGRAGRPRPRRRPAQGRPPGRRSLARPVLEPGTSSSGWMDPDCRGATPTGPDARCRRPSAPRWRGRGHTPGLPRAKEFVARAIAAGPDVGQESGR